MRRLSIDEALGRAQLKASEAIQAGDEALVLEVHGGEVVLVVPGGTDADAAVERSHLLVGHLHLENERVLTVEVPAHLIGTHYADAPVMLHGRGGTASLGGQRRGGQGMTAADIMTRTVITTGPDVPVKELAKRLTYHRISGMPVVDDQNRVLGVVSEADVISKRGQIVRDIMTSPVIAVEETTPAIEVAALLTEERIKRVPVLRDGRLVGLIGRSNVVSWVAGQATTAGATTQGEEG